MNDNRLDPSTERLVIREIVKFSKLKVWYYSLLGFVLGGATVTFATGYFYAQLVNLCF